MIKYGLLSFLIVSCNFSANDKVVKLNTTFTIFERTKNLDSKNMNDSVLIFEYNSMNLYQYPIFLDSYKVLYDKNDLKKDTITLRDSLISSRVGYFFYLSNGKLGFSNIKSTNKDNWIENLKNLDTSSWEAISYNKLNSNKFYENDIDKKLIKTNKNNISLIKNKEKIIIKYICKISTYNDNDTLTLEYVQNKQKINFSLNKNLDTISGFKLKSIEANFNESPNNFIGYKINLNQMQISISDENLIKGFMKSMIKLKF